MERRAVPGMALAALLAACSGSKAPGNTPATGAGGTWTGSVSTQGTTPAGIRFALQEANGTLTGKAWFEDPNTPGLFVFEDGGVTGTRQGSDATWVTSTGLVVTGRFDGDGFVGTLDYPPEYPLAFHRVDVVLER